MSLVILRIIIKRFLVAFIFSLFLISIILQIPQYINLIEYQAGSNISLLKILRISIYSFPRLIYESSMYAIIFTLLSVSSYIKIKNIRKNIILAGNNVIIYKYFLLMLSLTIYISLFFLNEKYFLKLDSLSKNMIIDNSKESNNISSVYKLEDGYIYARDYVKKDGKLIFLDIVIDKSYYKAQLIISKYGYLEQNSIILKDCILHKLNTGERLDLNNYKIELNIKNNINLLSYNNIYVNIEGINRIIEINPLSDIEHLLIIKKNKIMEIINGIMLLIFIVIVLFDLNIKSGLNYLIMFSLFFFINILNYKVNFYFINLSMKNDMFVLLEYALLVMLYVIIKFVIDNYNIFKEIK